MIYKLQIIPSALDPASDAALQNDNSGCQNLRPFLLQLQILGVLQEHLRLAQLVVNFSQNNLADFVGLTPPVGLQNHV